jgi:hypothetical protein
VDFARAAGQHVVRDLFNRLAEQFATLAVLLEQLFHLTAERLVAARAGASHKSRSQFGFALRRCVEDVFDLPPTLGQYGPSRARIPRAARWSEPSD